MPRNPFSYGQPVTGDAFTGRQVELEALVARVRSHINVTVSSPRRYGKTSLLVRAEERLASGRPAAAIVATNVLVCRDVDTLAGRLVAGVYRVPGARWHRSREAIAEFLRRLRLRPQISLGDDGKPIFSFGGLATKDADLLIEDVYRLLAEVSDRRPSALILDEFQAITRHGAHLPDLFKGLADEVPGVSLVICGSQHHLMEELVFSRRAPLYGMTERLALGPIPEPEMTAFLQARAGAGSKEMGPRAAARILELAGPVPNDVQRLAWETFNVAGRKMTVDDVERSFMASVDRESAMFADRLAKLTSSQGRVLVGIAVDEEMPLFSAAFARSVGLASGTSVKRAIDALAAAEIVARRIDTGRFAVTDPFFAAWLRRAASRR